MSVKYLKKGKLKIMEKYYERLHDIAVLQLDTQGFENLSDKQKHLAYYLSEAGLWGRFISVDQGSEYNIPLFNALIALYSKVDTSSILHKQLHETLFTLFAHNGIYHSMSGEKLVFALSKNELESVKGIEPELVTEINNILFTDKVLPFRNVQKEGVDVVKVSGGNFYKNLTTDEVIAFRKKHYPVVLNDEVPPFGFNERLVKNEDGSIVREVISQDGLYGNYVEKIIENLEKALDFVENEKQLKSISSLIDFYRTGDSFDFDRHCVAWTEDKDSDVYFINGLIESYEDPLSIGCTFESVVAFKNPLQTAKVNKIIDNIQWFEDNLPFDKKFKKEKAVGLSASSISVISMAGETAPSLPLGINLPNSDWIRKKHGSKSVNLANVSSSRSSYEVALRQALYLEKYHGVLEKYANMTNNLHTDLHEIAGHGSGKTLDGVNTDNLGIYYSTIEEARADLVALYYMADSKLRDFGVYDSDVNVDDASLAQYVSYITNGAIGQLRRVDLGSELTQAHLRNRQLISLWVLDNAESNKIKMVRTEEGHHYIEINDVQYVKNLLGQLLEKVQKIKSTGDFEGAKDLVMKYGTVINQDVHKKLLEKIAVLDMPKTIAFVTPILTPKDGTVLLSQSNDFFAQQMQLYQNYYCGVLEKKKEFKLK